MSPAHRAPLPSPMRLERLGDDQAGSGDGPQSPDSALPSGPRCALSHPRWSLGEMVQIHFGAVIVYFDPVPVQRTWARATGAVTVERVNRSAARVFEDVSTGRPREAPSVARISRQQEPTAKVCANAEERVHLMGAPTYHEDPGLGELLVGESDGNRFGGVRPQIRDIDGDDASRAFRSTAPQREKHCRATTQHQHAAQHNEQPSPHAGSLARVRRRGLRG